MNAIVLQPDDGEEEEEGGVCRGPVKPHLIPAEPAQYGLEGTFKNFSEKCGTIEAKIEGD